ncbi:type II toxin-antitoxin system PemK/MazF family toxin [Candidatus Woesearchaeota archaeon]|nr:type II toxin-antitoxin system PemK/MazF family toxin [Candidatus Woesearchaeota archaeon]
MYDQKDVVLMPFPYSNLTGSKLRPALIVSNGRVNRSDDRICCLITSNNPEDGLRVEHAHFKEGKLPFQIWVKPHRLFSIDKRIIRKKICTVTNEFHEKVVLAVDSFLATG